MFASQEVEPPALNRSLVLLGMESVGKSALFNRLTSSQHSEEANFRGVTVSCLSGVAFDEYNLIGTPGIRVDADSETTRMALSACTESDTLALVTRARYAREEINTLLNIPELANRKMIVVLTFADKEPDSHATAASLAKELGVPTLAINARHPTPKDLVRLRQLVRQAVPPVTDHLTIPVENHTKSPTLNFEARYPTYFRWLLLASMLTLFALPVYAAYWLSGSLESTVFVPLIESSKITLSHYLDGFWFDIVLGRYGVLSLGLLSFVWAFPVVFFLAISIAIADECGLKDKITTGLDPWLRVIGLQGRDLLPVLSGFGCNVVAVYQTRACSQCHRQNCVSLISFGSACSYQIGASLSIFSAYGQPGLFFFYLFTVFAVGALHTRIWSHPSERAFQTLAHPAEMQMPSWQGVQYRILSTLKQFLFQAMPVFIVICVVGGVLAYLGILSQIAEVVSPTLSLFHLPDSVAGALIFSVIRKDGLLVLNEGGGALLQTLSASQVFLTVYLGSTLSACLVTLLAIKKELGTKVSLTLAGRQMAMSILSAFVLSALFRMLS